MHICPLSWFHWQYRVCTLRSVGPLAVMDCILTAVLCIKCVSDAVWIVAMRMFMWVLSACWLCAELTELPRVFVVSLHWSWPPRWCPSRWERWRRSLCLIPSPCTTQMCAWGCQLPATCWNRLQSSLQQTACVSITHTRFKSLFAGLQYFCCSDPTEAPFVYLYDSNVFIESRKCQIGGSLLFAENVAYFLYNLIDSMNETEVHSKEEQIREYFSLLKNMVRWQTLKQCRELLGMPVKSNLSRIPADRHSQCLMIR